MSDSEITLQLLEELRKSNNSFQEVKQMIPRLEKIERNYEKLYESFLIHQTSTSPKEFKMLIEKVSEHDKSISLIQSELGISQKELKEQKDSVKTYLNKVWELLLRLLPAGGVGYLILESKGIL